MLLPCEYCGMPVEAEIFMKLGVPPCCKECSIIPLIAGVLGLVMFFGLGIYVFVTF